MQSELQWELESGKQLNPKSRRPPRIYQRDRQRGSGDDISKYEVALSLVAILTTLGFATLCAVIA